MGSRYGSQASSNQSHRRHMSMSAPREGSYNPMDAPQDHVAPGNRSSISSTSRSHASYARSYNPMDAPQDMVAPENRSSHSSARGSNASHASSRNSMSGNRQTNPTTTWVQDQRNHSYQGSSRNGRGSSVASSSFGSDWPDSVAPGSSVSSRSARSRPGGSSHASSRHGSQSSRSMAPGSHHSSRSSAARSNNMQLVPAPRSSHGGSGSMASSGYSQQSSTTSSSASTGSQSTIRPCQICRGIRVRMVCFDPCSPAPRRCNNCGGCHY
ncbi:hypothetical protein BGZ63DRAFT_391746 [Mariannaea sp. PMI_226]|nr:hypothetical protein BGZ63DRAFT_391746 [Mariannaea sp. PMI_226]